MQPKTLTSERMAAIRAHDDAAGPDLQMAPAAWSHRRELLQHIEASQQEESELVAELSTFLEPFSGGTNSLVDLVQRMRHANAIRQEIAAAMPVATESDEDRLTVKGPA